MIHYELQCGRGHRFDGWFPGSLAFDDQARSGLLHCPVCAATDVSRAIMAPRLARGARPDHAPASPAPPAAAEPPPQAAAGASPLPPSPMPDQLRATLQRLRAEVERRCDYVGPHFADTARAIHEGATPPRSIYGEATSDEAEALAEDGIEVARLPWVPRADG